MRRTKDIGAMTGFGLRLAATAAAFLAVAHTAGATTTLAVDCNANPQSGYLASRLTNVAPNTVVQITGMCLGDVTVTTSGLTLESNYGPEPVQPEPLPDSVGYLGGIVGWVEVVGAHGVIINGLSLALAAGESGNAVLWVHDQADVTLQGTGIGFAVSNGILVDHAHLAFQGGSVTYTGTSGNATVTGLVVDGGTVVLGFPNNDGTPVGSAAYFTWDLQNLQNGGCCGVGLQMVLIPSYWVNIDSAANSILVTRGGQLSAYQSATSGPVIATEGASLHLEGDAISAAMQASGKSALWVQNTTTNALSVLDGSSAILLGAGPQSLLASGGSSVVLASGNYITGPVQIDHASSLVEQLGTPYGVATSYQDIIQGAGLVQMGSAVELGNGYGNGVVWQGNLTVEQNSALRLSGGVEIVGSILLEQASNAFFNTAGGGGANSVSGGVSCVFSNVLASHVSGGGGVTPPIATVAVTPASASSQCLSF